MKTMITWIKAHRELILYVLLGGATTVVNFVSFKLFDVLLGGTRYLIANGIAWVIAVAFAYVVNKWWVFESQSWAPRVVLREATFFVAARACSFLIEEGGLYLLVDVARFDRLVWDLRLFALSGKIVAKLLLAVIVVVLNYFFSKWVVFRRERRFRP